MMGDSLLQLVDYGEDSDSSVESQQLNITKSTVQKPNDEVVHQKADTIEKAPSIEEQEGSKDYEIVSPKEQQPTEDTEQKFEIDQRIYDILTPKPIPNVPNWGIEDEPEGECDPGLQAKIEKFYEMRKQGLYFNAQMAKNKQYQNPNIYARLVEHLDLEQTGSNFDTSDFDPNGFPKELYIDQLLLSQRRLEAKRKEQQKPGKRNNIYFRPSSTTTDSEDKKAPKNNNIRAEKPEAKVDHQAIVERARAVAQNLTAQISQSNNKQPRRSKWDVGK